MRSKCVAHDVVFSGLIHRWCLTALLSLNVKKRFTGIRFMLVGEAHSSGR